MMKTLTILMLAVFLIVTAGALSGPVAAQTGHDGPGGEMKLKERGKPSPEERERAEQNERKMHNLMKEWAKGRPAEEVEAYQKQVKQIREKSEIWIQMAQLYMEKKDAAKAMETIRKVFAIQIPAGPLQAEMEKKKGHLYLMAVQMAFESGNEAEAQKLIEEAIRQFPDQPDVAFHLYRRMADIQRKKGNPDEALKFLEKAESLLNQLD